MVQHAVASNATHRSMQSPRGRRGHHPKIPVHRTRRRSEPLHPAKYGPPDTPIEPSPGFRGTPRRPTQWTAPTGQPAGTLAREYRRFDPIYEGVVFDDGTTSVVFAPHGLEVTDTHRTVFDRVPRARPCGAVAPLRPAVDAGGAVAWRRQRVGADRTHGPGTGHSHPRRSQTRHRADSPPRNGHSFRTERWPGITERMHPLVSYAPVRLGHTPPPAQ